MSRLQEKLVTNSTLRDPLNAYMENKISNFVTGFRKSHRTQYTLLLVLEKKKQPSDKVDKFM